MNYNQQFYLGIILLVIGIYVVFINSTFSFGTKVCANEYTMIFAQYFGGNSIPGILQNCDFIKIIYYSGWGSLIVGGFLVFKHFFH